MKPAGGPLAHEGSREPNQERLEPQAN
jgi:hypothetical protein